MGKYYRSDKEATVRYLLSCPLFSQKTVDGFGEISEEEFASITQGIKFDGNGLPVVTPPSEVDRKMAENALRKRFLFPPTSTNAEHQIE